jgi:hypothetical protein
MQEQSLIISSPTHNSQQFQQWQKHKTHKLGRGQQWPMTKLSIYFINNNVQELSDVFPINGKHTT